MPLLRELHDAKAAGRLERPGHVAQHDDRLSHLVEGVHDEHRIDGFRESRVGLSAEYGPHPLQPGALHPAPDRFDHLGLNVFGVNLSVRSDAGGQSNRKPPAACAEVSDRASVRDEQRVHHLIGPLPRVAVGALEHPELFRRKEDPVAVLRRRRSRRGHYGHG